MINFSTHWSSRFRKSLDRFWWPKGMIFTGPKSISKAWAAVSVVKHEDCSAPNNEVVIVVNNLYCHSLTVISNFFIVITLWVLMKHMINVNKNCMYSSCLMFWICKNGHNACTKRLYFIIQVLRTGSQKVQGAKIAEIIPLKGSET